LRNYDGYEQFPTRLGQTTDLATKSTASASMVTFILK